MAYRCDQAVFGGQRDPIRCKVSGTVCAHQKMCMMEGRIVLTDKAMTCPARDGQLPEEKTETSEEAGTEAVKTEKRTVSASKRTGSSSGRSGSASKVSGRAGTSKTAAKAPAKKAGTQNARTAAAKTAKPTGGKKG